MSMNTKIIPAVLSLLAGLVAVVVTYINKADIVEILTTLFVVLLSFYILGCIGRVIIDKCMGNEEEETEEEDTTEQELENIETDEQ